MGIQAINQVRFALLEKQGAILPHHQSCTTSACPLAYFHTISFTPHLTQWLIMLSNLIPLDVALFCSLSAHELQSHLQMFGRFKKAGGGGTEGKNILLISTAKCLQLVCVKLLCFAQGQLKSIGCKKAFHDKLLLVKIKFITPESCGCVLSSWGVKSSLQFNKKKERKKSQSISQKGATYACTI